MMAINSVLLYLAVPSMISLCDAIYVRPCPSLDLNSVRAFFARYSRCKPSYGAKYDTYYQAQAKAPVPHANLTLNFQELYAVGLNNGKIQELYYNPMSQQLVFEVLFDEITSYSPMLTITYFFKGREAVNLTDFFSITARKVSMTMTVPVDRVNGIRYSEKEVFTYLGDRCVPNLVGKNLRNCPDPEVQKSYKKFIDDLPLSIREAVITGDEYFDFYFCNNVCTF